MGSSLLGGELDGFINALSISLPLDGFYDRLNHSIKDLDNYKDECIKLCNKNESFPHIRLCKILLRFLNDSSTRTDNINFANDDCIPFNYWMYGELSKKYINREPYKLIQSFAELQSIWNSLIENKSKLHYFNKCKPDFNIPQQDDWEKRKELYDYCVNYDTLKKIRQSFKDKCNEYWTYVESHTSLYEHFEKNCSNPQYDRPVFYEECKKYNPKHVLRDFECHTEMMDKKAKEATTNARTTLGAGVPPGQETNSGMLTSSEFSSGGSHFTRDSTHPATKTGHILLGVVATSLTSGALYREELCAMDLDGTIII
ncbi:Plasmodium vivax Vir protein, putative [Plasmodium vivax]|uniref:Vir protein, putative n=1 Tax=Plasmodium vivax TaxID=5855 RepID=A0A1G4EDQ0_PLAVI|nr:Plasmodium vivax Vir protein, putative [Plasmodium vivax]